MLVFGLVLLGLKFREPVWSDLVTTRLGGFDYPPARDRTWPVEGFLGYTRLERFVFCGGIRTRMMTSWAKTNKKSIKVHFAKRDGNSSNFVTKNINREKDMSRVFTSSSKQAMSRGEVSSRPVCGAKCARFWRFCLGTRRQGRYEGETSSVPNITIT